MTTRILVDFHHSALLRSLVMLFEDRLGFEVYRPIGLDWETEGFWAVYPSHDTAMQFLSFDQSVVPDFGGPLNTTAFTPRVGTDAEGVYYCADPGGDAFNRACTLEYFSANRFDYVLASIPQHVPLFERLIRERQPGAKLLQHIGNNWSVPATGHVLASIKPQPTTAHVCWAHQEFDLSVFSPTPCTVTRRVTSLINCLGQSRTWTDFRDLEEAVTGYQFLSCGGQCRNGSYTGARAVAAGLKLAQFVFHVKDPPDGYGHVIYGAAACGRPLIVRRSLLKDTWAEELLVEGSYFDLDALPLHDLAAALIALGSDASEAAGTMWASGQALSDRFTEVVDFEAEAAQVRLWLP